MHPASDSEAIQYVADANIFNPHHMERVISVITHHTDITTTQRGNVRGRIALAQLGFRVVKPTMDRNPLRFFMNFKMLGSFVRNLV